MKKIVLSLALMLSASAFSQIAPPRNIVKLQLAPNGKNILDNSREMRTGPWMMIGGVSFIAAGLLTTPFTQGSSNVPKPFWQQGPRTLAVISGSIVFVAGIAFTLGGD